MNVTRGWLPLALPLGRLVGGTTTNSGTCCRTGANAETAVVDFDRRGCGTENVYVAHGAALPSLPGVNSQMMIMAFATRAAERIAGQR